MRGGVIVKYQRVQGNMNPPQKLYGPLNPFIIQAQDQHKGNYHTKKVRPNPHWTRRRKKKLMEPTVVNGSVHTGCKQLQNICVLSGLGLKRCVKCIVVCKVDKEKMSAVNTLADVAKLIPHPPSMGQLEVRSSGLLEV